MHGLPLLKRCPQRPVQAVLEIEVAIPGHDMGEQVAIKGRVLFEQGLQVEGPLGRHELIKPHLVGSDRGPVLLNVAVLGVRSNVADALKNHSDTVTSQLSRLNLMRCRESRRYRIVTIGGTAVGLSVSRTLPDPQNARPATCAHA